MADIACTLIVKSVDQINFPVDMMLVVMKELFSYGVRDISLKGDEVFIKLKYTPKSETLKNKFGNLPINYIRSKTEEEKELNLLEVSLKRYKFNQEEGEHEQVMAIEDAQSTFVTKAPEITTITRRKRK